MAEEGLGARFARLSNTIRILRETKLLGNLGLAGIPVIRRARKAGALGPQILFALHAANIPNQTAIIFRDRKISYKELNDRINRTASGLLKLGLKPGDKVALMVTNCNEYIETSIALQKLGMSMVPLSTQLKAKEANYILSNSDATAVVLSDSKQDVIREAIAGNGKISESRCVVVGKASGKMTAYDEVQRSGSAEEVLVNLKEVKTSLIMYTSGTTGKPKGAERKMSSVGGDVILSYIDLNGLKARDVHYCPCPLYHAAPTAYNTLTWVLGGTVIIVEKFDAEQMLKDVERYRVTTTQMVPTQFNRLVNLPAETLHEYDHSSLRVMITAAAYCSPALKKKILDTFGPVLFEMYGATELGMVTVARPEDLKKNPSTIGKKVPAIEIRLLDDNGKEVGVDQPGELFVGSKFLIDGYYKDEAATQSSKKGGFFSVGDVAKVDAEGYYYILDRKKDMVISGGVNIYPAEIEEELLQHPAVFDAAVVGVPDEEWGEALKAFVVLKPGQKASEAELIGFCAERLAKLKKPKSIEFMDELPRNPQGKVLKRELREKYWAGRETRV
ncbi:MAG: AMP-binding protein [Bdellovibrionota bacterium]